MDNGIPNPLGGAGARVRDAPVKDAERWLVYEDGGEEESDKVASERAAGDCKRLGLQVGSQRYHQ